MRSGFDPITDAHSSLSLCDTDIILCEVFWSKDKNLCVELERGEEPHEVHIYV